MAKKQGKSTGQNLARQRQKEAQKQARAEERVRKEETQAVKEAEQAAKPKDSPRLQWPAPREAGKKSADYRFLNPYNFVRYLPEPIHIPKDDPAVSLLGRCTPPPHDRYTGISGRITCRLETVTPLFVADSHEVEVTKGMKKDGQEVEHRSYRFFQYEKQDAIPASSLRGMIRSTFEAVTNSPFAVFDADKRLEYRIDPSEARRFKPGIVQSLAQGGQSGKIVLCEEAKVGAYYGDPAADLVDESWKCGEAVWAVVGKTKNNVPKVFAIGKGHRSEDAADTYNGWLKITGPTITSKRNESFFYFKGSDERQTTVCFDIERENDFNYILHAQLHDRKEDFHSQVQSDRLAVGNLVYVEVEANDATQVRNIALARVARLRYRNSIGSRLPKHLRPSEEYHQLDIASRIFGWVKPGAGESSTESVAYAGRVKVSHALLTEDGDNGIYEEPLSLAILGEPKPTTTLFYLRKKEGVWSEQERKKPGSATTIGYDGPNTLGGRKFYRHHGSAVNSLEYRRFGNIPDHQNRTVRGVRVPGNIFEFSIEFSNLAAVEMGALLWTLNLGSEGCVFRLGYAKPLGFGSVNLWVQSIELYDFGQRYLSLHSPVGRTAQVGEKSQWLESFELAMQRCYGSPIRELVNIKDIVALLSESEQEETLPIHYPRSNPTPDPEGKNFAWFVSNKSKSTNVQKAGPNLSLELPGDEQGLTLI